MAFSFIKLISSSDTLTKREAGREAAVLKICAPAIITSAEVIIAEYDAILGQWERENFYNHLSNYTKYSHRRGTTVSLETYPLYSFVIISVQSVFRLLTGRKQEQSTAASSPCSYEKHTALQTETSRRESRKTPHRKFQRRKAGHSDWLIRALLASSAGKQNGCQ